MMLVHTVLPPSEVRQDPACKIDYVTFVWLVLILSSLCQLEAASQTQSSSATTNWISQLVAQVPNEYPHFTFANHPEAAQLLTHYLWYHFHHRLGNSPRLFDKEYVLTSDIWMGHLSPRGSTEPIQDVHRRNLLNVFLDDEGYVSSHQHFSQAHDLGWPFPSWAQASNNPEEVKGKSVGWHFQPLDKVPGWVGAEFLKKYNLKEYCGETAASRWELEHVKSLGIQNLRWQLEATGMSPTITTPEGYSFDGFNAPYLQLRWKRTGTPKDDALPYVEWLREGDTEYGLDRRVYFSAEQTPLSRECFHSIMTMYRHPQWNGKIKRVRISLAPGEADTKFEIDSFFTVYDTRHTINNPIFILASCRYFNWTGDVDFLRRQINRLRLALRYQQTVLGGLRYNHIRNPWPGHDGLPSWHKDAKGKLTFNPGHGIGNNYWDILPFGWDDMYAANQYYAATIAMAGLEEAIQQHPGWNIPPRALTLDPKELGEHAERVKETANRLFWSESSGRFVACIDKEGTPHDYGYTFLNLDSIWYDLASPEHGRQILDWITGKRIIAGDTSFGEDIYRWRFGPRASTRRNVEWYGQGWWAPESLPWGYQIQDGGAVLGFTFYDLWARLKILGPDNAWQRLLEILTWEKDVRAEGGYREYYKGEKRGTTLQGGGTCGGLGIDFEFYESSLVPAIIPYGFVGLDARPDGRLFIHPRLPDACPELAISNVQYRNAQFDFRVANKSIQIRMQKAPPEPLQIEFLGTWVRRASNWRGSAYTLRDAGEYAFARCD